MSPRLQVESGIFFSMIEQPSIILAFIAVALSCLGLGLAIYSLVLRRRLREEQERLRSDWDARIRGYFQ